MVKPLNIAPPGTMSVSFVITIPLLIFFTLCFFVSASLAADEVPPDWRRIRTNSVPYSPEDITIDSDGGGWVTAASNTEYDPGVWYLSPAKSQFQYFTNSKANNWLGQGYNTLLVKPHLNDEVNYVLKDKAGNIWYALNNRTVLCERPDASILSFAMENTQSETGFPITTNVDSAHAIRLIENSDGTQDVLLIGATNLKRIDSTLKVADSRTEYISGNQSYINDLFIDSHGRCWVANGYGLQYGSGTSLLGTTYLEYSDYKNDPDIPGSPEPITAIAEDTLGNLWFTSSNGLYCLTAPNGTDDWVKYDLSALAQTSNIVTAMAQGTNGVMWFASAYQGIVKYTPETGWSRITCASLGLPSEMVLSLAQHNNTLWFTAGEGNYDRGLHALNLEDSSVASYTYRGSSTTLTSHRINSIAADLSGGVWFAAYDLPSVARLKPDGTWVQYREDTMDLIYERGSGGIAGIGVDRGNIVFMAPNRRAPIAYDIKTEKWIDLPAGPPDETYFYGLYIDPENGKWFLGADHVYYLNADNTSWTLYDTSDETKFHDYRIQRALMDNAGNLWFMGSFVSGELTLMKKAPEGGSASWIKFKTGDETNYKGGSWVFQDKNGQVWNTGAQVYNPETRQWIDQSDTSLFDKRPLRFLNGTLSANMDIAGAPVPVENVDQERMTVDTNGNIYFCGGMVWLQSINAGIVVRSPVKGDMNRDNRIQLDDTLLSLESFTGGELDFQATPSEVNGNARVDAIESIYMLQKITGSR